MRPFHRFAIIVAALMLTFPVQAQHFDWVRTYTAPDISSGSTTNRIIGSCVDSAGNFYFIGEFSPQASLCGVNLVPHNIITIPLKTAVVIAKLSPQGELLWHKAIYNTLVGSYAIGLCQMGDTAFMAMTQLGLPYDFGYGEHEDLYYLDTLLTGNNDFLMSTDSITNNRLTAFITFDNNGNVLEQRFVCIGWQDTNGVTLTPRYMGWDFPEYTLDKVYSRQLLNGNGTFNVDNEGNIYVVRMTSDNPYVLCDTCDGGARYWTIQDGTIGALKIIIDGQRSLYYPVNIRSAIWNYQILKFSPHFNSLLSAVYVFDSTYEVDPHLDVFFPIYSSMFDNQGNLYLNMYNTAAYPLVLSIANNNTLQLDLQSDLYPTWLLRYNSDLQPTGLIQMSSTGDFPVAMKIFSTHVDENTNSLYISGCTKWGSYGNPDSATMIYRQDSIEIHNLSGFWLRLDNSDLNLINYWTSRQEDNWQVTTPELSTYGNRVFSQTFFNAGVHFADTTITTVNITDLDIAFMVWDNEGHEIMINNRRVANINSISRVPIVYDSVVYLSGTLFDNATFGSITTQTMGHSYAYIAKYVDTAFMTPYVYVEPQPQEAQTILWEQDLALLFTDSPVALTAISTSGLPVTYTCSDTGIAYVDGSTLHLLAEGSATVTASQAGDGHYLPADPVTKTLHVSSATGIAAGNGDRIAIHPNPTRDILWFNTGSSGTVRAIRAVSTIGVYYNVPFREGKADLTILPAGAYYLSFITDNNIYQHKIIKL